MTLFFWLLIHLMPKEKKHKERKYILENIIKKNACQLYFFSVKLCWNFIDLKEARKWNGMNKYSGGEPMLDVSGLWIDFLLYCRLSSNVKGIDLACKFWQFGKGNFDSFEKGNFDSLEKGNFDSLKKEILTVWKLRTFNFNFSSWYSSDKVDKRLLRNPI
jgi:hypothetical protein